MTLSHRSYLLKPCSPLDLGLTTLPSLQIACSICNPPILPPTSLSAIILPASARVHELLSPVEAMWVPTPSPGLTASPGYNNSPCRSGGEGRNQQYFMSSNPSGWGGQSRTAQFMEDAAEAVHITVGQATEKEAGTSCQFKCQRSALSNLLLSPASQNSITIWGWGVQNMSPWEAFHIQTTTNCVCVKPQQTVDCVYSLLLTPTWGWKMKHCANQGEQGGILRNLGSWNSSLG